MDRHTEEKDESEVDEKLKKALNETNLLKGGGGGGGRKKLRKVCWELVGTENP